MAYGQAEILNGMNPMDYNEVMHRIDSLNTTRVIVLLLRLNLLMRAFD